MNDSRLRRLLEGQSATARKLYEFVPYREAWVEGDIAKAAHNGHVRVGLHVIRKCLLDMKDAGLIKETQRHYYQRVSVTKAKKQPTHTNEPSANEAIMSKPTAPAVPPTLIRNEVSAAPVVDSMDLLAGVSTELTKLGVEFIGRIKALAGRVDEVALQVEAQREADIAKMAKVNQLQALMKDLGGQ